MIKTKSRSLRPKSIIAAYWRTRLFYDRICRSHDAELNSLMREWIALNQGSASHDIGSPAHMRAIEMAAGAEGHMQPWDWLDWFLTHAVFFPGAPEKEPVGKRARWRHFYSRTRASTGTDGPQPEDACDAWVKLLYATAWRWRLTPVEVPLPARIYPLFSLEFTPRLP
jgi:hypothetical protein